MFSKASLHGVIKSRDCVVKELTVYNKIMTFIHSDET